MLERLQKIIAAAGIASRRASEQIITGGRVRVNGRVVTELGTKADPREDKVEVDGKRITASSPVYVALHKPRNVVSTLSDPEGRPSVAELLESVGTRVFPVGRLDFATSGLLLATNDGDFSQGLLHPKKGVPKMYVVKVNGEMEPRDVEVWATGVNLEDGRTQAADVHFLRHEEGKTWFEITIFEGRNQQIRRMGEATGFPVMRLARVSFAGVTSEDLRPGQWRFLTVDELMDLRKEYGVPKRVRAAEAAARGTKAFGKVQARGERRDGAERARAVGDGGRRAAVRETWRGEDRPRDGATRDVRPAREAATGDAPQREARPRRDAPPRYDAPARSDAPQREARPRRDAPPPRSPKPRRNETPPAVAKTKRPARRAP